MSKEIYIGTQVHTCAALVDVSLKQTLVVEVQVDGGVGKIIDQSEAVTKIVLINRRVRRSGTYSNYFTHQISIYYVCNECHYELQVRCNRPVKGLRSTHQVCDSACLSAKTDGCVCSCKGQNHGRGWFGKHGRGQSS